MLMEVFEPEQVHEDQDPVFLVGHGVKRDISLRSYKQYWSLREKT